MQVEHDPGLNQGSNRFRVDVDVHQLLMSGHKRAALIPIGAPLTLPEPVFPQFPDRAGDIEPDAKFLPKDGNPYRTSITPVMVKRGLRGWLYPYVRSRVMPGDFHPIIAYLFTEWKCNLDCH